MGSARQMEAVLSQNVLLPPRDLADPSWLGERTITSAFKAFPLEKRKKNIKAKVSSPLKGRTC